MRQSSYITISTPIFIENGYTFVQATKTLSEDALTKTESKYQRK